MLGIENLLVDNPIHSPGSFGCSPVLPVVCSPRRPGRQVVQEVFSRSEGFGDIMLTDSPGLFLAFRVLPLGQLSDAVYSGSGVAGEDCLSVGIVADMRRARCSSLPKLLGDSCCQDTAWPGHQGTLLGSSSCVHRGSSLDCFLLFWRNALAACGLSVADPGLRFFAAGGISI